MDQIVNINHDEKINNNTNQNKLKLYVHGSCQCDQFYHPKGSSESRRPICLSDLDKFQVQQEQSTFSIENPLLKVNICKIACGSIHSIILTTCGKIFTFGCNDEGALGRQGRQKIPEQVKLDTPVDLITAGDNHSLFANSIAGIIYFVGSYKFLKGQNMMPAIKIPIKIFTRDIDTRNKSLPIDRLISGANHSCILIGGKIFCRGQPQAYTTGRRINERHKIENSLTFDGVGLNNVVDVWCGGYHTVAKLKKGQSYAYYGWGSNSHGQLGINSFHSQLYPVQIKKLKNKNIVKMAAGTNFSIFLADTGQLWGCGLNEDGQIGQGQMQKVDKQNQLEMKEQQQKNQRKQYKQIQDENKQQQIEQQIQKNNIHQASGLSLLKQQVEQKMSLNDKNQQNLYNFKILGTQQIQLHKVQQQQDQKMIIENKLQQLQTQKNINNNKKQQINQQKIQKINNNNLYIKTLKQIQISNNIKNIQCGELFTFAWNQQQLYSWGFGNAYVLLNGQQQDQLQPFSVKSKLFGGGCVHEISAGSSHVLLTTYQHQMAPNIEMHKSIRTSVLNDKMRLSRKRK